MKTLWELRLLDAIAERVALAVENAHLHQRVQDAAVIQERERIAREMHDGLGQVLGYINTKTLAVKKLITDSRVSEAYYELSDMEEIARDLYADVHEGILGLRTSAHRNGGLVTELRQYIEQYGEMSGLEANFRVAGQSEKFQLAPSVEIQLMRILQEALTNVRKHADASTVSVDFRPNGSELEVEVTDNGRGFDPEGLPAAGWPRFGLQTMRERAESVGGSFKISPGLYAAEVEFPIFGSWDVTLEVVEYGQGEVSFVEEVLPASPGQVTTEVRQQVLDLFFRFDWRDVVAIAVRVSHVAGAAIWLGMTGLILAGFWFFPRPARAAMFRKLAPVFLPVSFLGLGVLALSGVYTGIYSAPIKPPGIFDFDIMMRIPFGPHYLGTMGFKVLALAAYGFIALRMAPALRSASLPTVAGGALAFAENSTAFAGAQTYTAVERSLYRMAVTNAVLGAALAVAVSVAIYLHYISHLAVLIPQ